MGESALSMLSSFKSHELSITLWAFARLGVCHSALFTAAANALHKSPSLRKDLHAQGVANLLWALVKHERVCNNVQPNPAFHDALRWLLPRCRQLLPEMGPAELGQVLWAATRLLQGPEALTHADHAILSALMVGARASLGPMRRQESRQSPPASDDAEVAAPAPSACPAVSPIAVLEPPPGLEKPEPEKLVPKSLEELEAAAVYKNASAPKAVAPPGLGDVNACDMYGGGLWSKFAGTSQEGMQTFNPWVWDPYSPWVWNQSASSTNSWSSWDMSASSAEDVNLTPWTSWVDAPAAIGAGPANNLDTMSSPDEVDFEEVPRPPVLTVVEEFCVGLDDDLDAEDATLEVAFEVTQFGHEQVRDVRAEMYRGGLIGETIDVSMKVDPVVPAELYKLCLLPSLSYDALVLTMRNAAGQPIGTTVTLPLPGKVEKDKSGMADVKACWGLGHMTPSAYARSSECSTRASSPGSPQH
eukprot:gnl/TRDRNA2_/TRDRNA2_133894_c1_seq1.p1 gnl/TRDRNA2_/TRDRNA2_133894_c1~~gnl/TRDRNA2_/TRDRNA2_133894_c1_seq1.p1  ORF type:complete len:513 (-),score=90.20 gnl/TRDRNA2_/TRDRNA2_133894_c1_seq1:19-1434(-)